MFNQYAVDDHLYLFAIVETTSVNIFVHVIGISLQEIPRNEPPGSKTHRF